ncbi:MAG: hypothetical protein GX309_07410, partial [Clostridiales bacterium]|nr:hypothetical protein [Clostridiales bacterium]
MRVGKVVKYILLPHTLALDMTVDTCKAVFDEECSDDKKERLKKVYLKYNPIANAVYKIGQNDGKKEGYTEASKEYEKKLLDQAEKFINQQKIYEEQNEEYDSLLDEYEKIIEELINKKNKTDEENEYLK